MRRPQARPGPLRRSAALVALCLAASSLMVLVNGAPAGAVVVIDARLESPTITFGQTATVIGEVNNPSESPTVVLQRKVGDSWQDRNSTSVDPGTGAFTIVLRPSASGPYTLRVRSQGGTVVSGSFTLAVNPAKPSITARLSQPKTVVGQPVQVLGTFTPPRATPRVILQRAINGRWYDRGMAVVDRETGAYSLTVTPSQAGTYALRVRSLGGTVISRQLYLQVLPPDLP